MKLFSTLLFHFILEIRNRRLQLEALSHLVQLLPTAHRDTLFVLLRFLAKVASCCDDVSTSDGSVNIAGNKMDSNNLATVFAPNILRSSLPGEENNEQESMGDVINVIRFASFSLKSFSSIL